MSFILDALKKSESERQRQSGPALFEVKVAPPRNRFAVWGVALGALLAVNLVVVGWIFWRGGSSRAAAAPTASTAPTAAASLPPPAPSAAATPGAAGSPIAAAQSARGSAAAPPLEAARRTVDAPSDSAREDSVSPGAEASTAAPGSADSAPAETGGGGASPDDLAPAVEPAKQPSQTLPGVIRATSSGLPTYQDAAAQPGSSIPDLRLDLHVYAPEPQQRFVFLNMLKLHEGDMTPKGVRVERITPDGVILSYRGKEFVLQRQ